MAIIRCETCKGRGTIKYDLPPVYYAGHTVDFSRKEQVDINCPNCGGSGCKWQELQEEV